MSERVEIEYALTVNVEDAVGEIRTLERLLFRSLMLIRRLGLPDEVEKAIVRIQSLITVLRSLQIAAIALQAAEGPIGWATAIVSTASAVAITAGAMYDLDRGS
jgi:hypothetical protein